MRRTTIKIADGATERVIGAPLKLVSKNSSSPSSFVDDGEREFDEITGVLPLLPSASPGSETIPGVQRVVVCVPFMNALNSR